jgi:hypothetical protein
MRKIVFGLFTSLNVPDFNDEMGAAVCAMMQNSDANLFGRKTFEVLATYWPQPADDIPCASHINRIKK